MQFEEKTLTLRNGKLCTLRPALPEDAEAMIEYLKTVSGETPFLSCYPDEVTGTVESERKFLEHMLEDGRSLMMNAYVDGRLAGNCGLSPVGDKRRVRHRASLGIAQKQAYCGLGIGTAMMDRVFALAGEAGYTQIELEAADGNSGALRFYKLYGFLEIGRHPDALRYDDGTCRDVILMVKALGAETDTPPKS